MAVSYISYGQLPQDMARVLESESLQPPTWPPELSGGGQTLVTPGERGVSYTIDWTMGQRTVDRNEFAEAFNADWQAYSQGVEAIHGLVDQVRDVVQRSGLNDLSGADEYWSYDLEAREVSWAFEAPAVSEEEARELTPELFKAPRQLGYDDGDPSDMALYEHAMDTGSYVNDIVGAVVRVVEADQGMVRVGREDPMSPDDAVAHLRGRKELDPFRSTSGTPKVVDAVPEPVLGAGLPAGSVAVGENASQRATAAALPVVGRGRVEVGTGPQVGQYAVSHGTKGPDLRR